MDNYSCLPVHLRGVVQPDYSSSHLRNCGFKENFPHGGLAIRFRLFEICLRIALAFHNELVRRTWHSTSALAN